MARLMIGELAKVLVGTLFLSGFAVHGRKRCDGMVRMIPRGERSRLIYR